MFRVCYNSRIAHSNPFGPCTIAIRQLYSGQDVEVEKKTARTKKLSEANSKKKSTSVGRPKKVKAVSLEKATRIATTRPKKPPQSDLIRSLIKSYARLKMKGGNKRRSKLVAKKGDGDEVKEGVGAADKTRLHVVSETLCDDVLQRLAPSLEKHMNCDIIDLNPGVGIWSAKLHEILKPRTHILMEPDTDVYLPYLTPLTQNKDSNYKLVPRSGLIWENLVNLMNGDLLEYQDCLEKDDPRLEQPNDSLLVIANLGHFPRKTFLGFSSIALLTLHQLLTAIRTHVLFQRYGQVRMLIWLHDKEKAALLPRLVGLRSKFCVHAQVVCQSIDEIAGSDTPVSRNRRETLIDLESAKAVRQRMDKAKITTPSGRMTALETQAAENTVSTETRKGFMIKNGWLSELDDLLTRYNNKEFPAVYNESGEPVYLDWAAGKALSNAPTSIPRTPEFARMRRLQWNLDQLERKAGKFEIHVNEYEGLMNELATLQLDDGAEAVARSKEIALKLRDWRETLDHDLTDGDGSKILKFIEDRRALRQDPPLLLWDRRRAEPIKTLPTDFFPEHEMCLIDFQPKSIWPILRGSDNTNYDYFDFLMSSLYNSPSQTLIHGLKAVAPGAAEWILPKCPSLTNPAKGGLPLVEELTVRGLSEDMMREIIENFMEWPFRPTKGDILTRMGGLNLDDDTIEGKD